MPFNQGVQNSFTQTQAKQAGASRLQ